MSDVQESEIKGEKKRSMKTWLKRLGVAGFLFFFIKGLVWLAIFYGFGKTIKEFFFP